MNFIQYKVQITQNYIMLVQTSFKNIYQQNKIFQVVGEPIA